jgi:hypothetical protein
MTIASWLRVLTRNASLNGVALPFGRRPSPPFSDLVDSTDTLDTLFIRWMTGFD